MWETIEDIKGVTISRKSKSNKDRQCNGQKKIDKRKNNDLQNTTQKTKGWATRTSQKKKKKKKKKNVGELGCSGSVSSSCSTSEVSLIQDNISLPYIDECTFPFLYHFVFFILPHQAFIKIKLSDIMNTCFSFLFSRNYFEKYWDMDFNVIYNIFICFQ
jgi:hypothetical protein